MKEIEYKFLVDKDKWSAIDKPQPQHILQGFLYKSKELVIRIRIKDDMAFITIKGDTKGITRSEFEYPIPVKDAKSMMYEFMDKFIEKLRYEIPFNGKTWEIDVFKGKLEGLILAELEVTNEHEQFDLPDWVTEDVSTDPAYYNANLIDR